jgi:polysaccharide deacetylase family protein (PEP-CTERM system associated)
MTVDVEDYYHVSTFDGVVPRSDWGRLESRVAANTRRLLDIFEESNVRGTFFILGLVAERHPDLVHDIARQGHEIASHGYAHRLVYDQTPQAFRDDVRRAKALLESATGARVLGYRAPSYSITPRSLWALDILAEEGHEYDASIFPIRHDRYGIPVSARHPYAIDRHGHHLVEVPGSTTQIWPLNLPVGGGGYFRLLPYAWTRWGIGRINRVERRPAVFYLHPWEIDPGQPRLRVGLLGRVRHYWNLEHTAARLRALLNDFAFAPLCSILATQTIHSEPVPGHLSVPEPLPYLW